jgi:hypothetical protein
MAEKTVVRETSAVSTAVKLIVSVAAIVVGLFLVFGATTPAVADGVFVGSIALVLAVYLWTGVTVGQGRVISVVLALVAAYAFIRQLGGITAIVSGVILLLPFVRAQLAKRKE